MGQAIPITGTGGNGRLAWTRAYLAVSRAKHPNIWQIRTELPEVDDEAISPTILSLFIDGLRRRAPRPCDCAKHG